jgi:hypothetical protein
MPDPSITLPFLIRTSYDIGFPPRTDAIQPVVVEKL